MVVGSSINKARRWCQKRFSICNRTQSQFITIFAPQMLSRSRGMNYVWITYRWIHMRYLTWSWIIFCEGICSKRYPYYIHQIALVNIFNSSPCVISSHSNSDDIHPTIISNRDFDGSKKITHFKIAICYLFPTPKSWCVRIFRHQNCTQYQFQQLKWKEPKKSLLHLELPHWNWFKCM